jgi:hypothetical protein
MRLKILSFQMIDAMRENFARRGAKATGSP